MHECMGQNAEKASLALIQGLHTLTPHTELTNVGSTFWPMVISSHKGRRAGQTISGRHTADREGKRKTTVTHNL